MGNENYLDEARKKLQRLNENGHNIIFKETEDEEIGETVTMPVQRFFRRFYGKYSYSVEKLDPETIEFGDVQDFEINEEKGFAIHLPNRIDSANSQMILFLVLF